MCSELGADGGGGGEVEVGLGWGVGCLFSERTGRASSSVRCWSLLILLTKCGAKGLW